MNTTTASKGMRIDWHALSEATGKPAYELVERYGNLPVSVSTCAQIVVDHHVEIADVLTRA